MSECEAKNQGVYQGVKGPRELGSSLGPDSAEHPLKPHYKTQNQAKRFNRLDNQNCFGTRCSTNRSLGSTFMVDTFARLTGVGFSDICNAAVYNKHWASEPPRLRLCDYKRVRRSNFSDDITV